MSRSNTPRVLIVGLGRIGMEYDLHLDPERFVLTHARAFSRHAGFQLAAGVDPDAARRVAFEKAYGCATYAMLDEALDSVKPDLLVVAVPTSAHCEIIERTLARVTPTTILCEKPLAYDLSDAAGIAALCEKRGIALYVNYMRRADPGVIEIGRRIRAGEIASPVKGVVWYSKGFLHNGSHFFDLVQNWLGTVERSQVISPGRPLAGADAEPDVCVEFTRGTVFFLAAKEEDYSHYSAELIAPNGRLRYERGGRSIIWHAVGPHAMAGGQSMLADQPTTIASGMDRYQWHVVEELAQAIEGRSHHLSTAGEALATLETMHQILEQR